MKKTRIISLLTQNFATVISQLFWVSLQHCGFYLFPENASRFCHANGTWDSYTNYDQCDHVDPIDEMDILPHVELATNIYSAGYTLSLIALSLGLAVFIHFK